MVTYTIVCRGRVGSKETVEGRVKVVPPVGKAGHKLVGACAAERLIWTQLGKAIMMANSRFC